MNSKKILMVNRYCGMIGGIERYMTEMSQLLRDDSWEVAGFFAEKVNPSSQFTDSFDCIHIASDQNTFEQLENIHSEGFDIVVIHKLMDSRILAAVVDIFPTAIAVIHDHDYYCMRSHKYFPYKRINCKYPFNLLRCSICSGMITKHKGSFLPFVFNNPLKYAKRLSILKKVTQVVVLSDYMKGNMLENGFSDKAITKIYPAVNVGAEEDKNELNTQCIRLLFAGQVIRGKGLDLLLNSLTHVHSDYCLRIVGRGNDDGFIREQIKDLKLDAKVDFKGFSENINEDYRWADIVIVPSRWQEPFGLVGIEAFSRKVPVIGFDVGGISEWLRDGVNGILVESGNCEKMATAIDVLANDCELRRKFGQSAYDFVVNECNKEQYLDKLCIKY